MEKNRVSYDYITDFIKTVRRERTGALGELERQARAENFPISEPEVSDLLEVLCMIKKPARVLEIGTCIGFSALLIHSVVPDAEIITMERNPAMLGPAKENFEKFGVADKIKIIEGDAVAHLPEIEPYFDLIYIDAAKGQYPIFLEQSKRLLSSGGILLCDNVLFNGMVAKGKPDRHRNKTIVVRLTEFINNLENDGDFTTTILPAGDGVTLSVKK